MVAPVIAAAAIGAGATLAGGALSGSANRKLMHEQMDMQREFAQHGIRWKVEDAKAAGVHPLYALGASTAMPSPIAVSDSYGPSIVAAGQDVSRAMMASATAEERAEALRQQQQQAFRQSELRAPHQARMAALHTDLRTAQVIGARLDTQKPQQDLELGQLNITRHFRNAQVGPGMPPSLNTPMEGGIKIEPGKVGSRMLGGDSHVEAGRTPLWKEYEFLPQWSVLGPTQDAGESFENEVLGAMVLTPSAMAANYSHLLGQIRKRYPGWKAETQADVYRFLQNRGVYPRRRGM